MARFDASANGLYEGRWDPAKDVANRRRHGVGFDEIRGIFEWPADYLMVYDAEHSEVEVRFIAIAAGRRGVVTVAFTEPRDGVARIVSARKATRREAEALARYMGGRRR